MNEIYNKIKVEKKKKKGYGSCEEWKVLDTLTMNISDQRSIVILILFHSEIVSKRYPNIESMNFSELNITNRINKN